MKYHTKGQIFPFQSHDKRRKKNSIASGLRFNKRRITSLNVTYEYFIFPNKPNFIENIKK